MNKGIMVLDIPESCGECDYNSLFGDGVRRCGLGTFEDVIDEYDDSRPDWCPIEPMPGKWIPCSERLPDEEGTYLLTVETTSGIRWVKSGMLYSDEGFVPHGKVIAWMPLPEPYKESEA